MTKEQVFAELEARGVAKAVAVFSGGNDEGGVDQITLFNEDDIEIGSLEPYYGRGQVYDSATGSWKPIEDPDKTGDNDLAMALGGPSDDRWGSYAGEFYVSGEVIWTVADRKVKMDYDEEVPSSDHHEEYV